MAENDARKRRALLGAVVLAVCVGTQPAAAHRAPEIGPGNLVAHGAARFVAPAPLGFEQAAENQTFVLYANPETLAFKVLDKRNGYLWHSNLDAPQPGDRLNRTWAAFAASGVSIEYLDARAVNRRISLSSANVEKTYSATADGFAAELRFSDFGIALQLRVALAEDGVTVEVPFDSIRQDDPAYRLGLLYLYPFMGATRADEIKGYTLIPDGSGALIPFGATTRAKSMFYGRYYGPDLGMLERLPFDPNINRPHRLSVPVLGMAHEHDQGGNAYLLVIEEGAAYAELHAHPAGIITNFNFAYTPFIYNQSYFQTTNRAGAGVTTIQRFTNSFNVRLRYRFLAGADSDYVGMARSYQRYLLERGQLKSTPVNGQQAIGIRLEFLGGDKEPVLLWHRMVAMTTVRQMQAILRELNLPRAQVVYYGWQPFGASSMPGSQLAIDRQLGSLADLKTLSAEVQSNGGRLYLYLDPQAALHNEGGYSLRQDLAMAITGLYMSGHNRNKANYYFNVEAVQKRLPQLAEQVAKQLSAGLAIDQLGNTLYGDFRSQPPLNREQALQHYSRMLADLALPMAFYNPNAHAFHAMDAYFDMPLSDSGYLFVSQGVPFLPIVLAGYVPYYGPALNFSPDLNTDRLRHADYGAYPSFFLSGEETAKMLNTPSNWIFSSTYAQWRDEVERVYRWLNALLAPAAGQSIVQHQALADGVFATTYDNGYTVVTNYSSRPFTWRGRTTPAEDARGFWEVRHQQN